jgi:hypothetical protein
LYATLVENTSAQEEILTLRSQRRWVNRKKLVFNNTLLIDLK